MVKFCFYYYLNKRSEKKKIKKSNEMKRKEIINQMNE